MFRCAGIEAFDDEGFLIFMCRRFTFTTTEELLPVLTEASLGYEAEVKELLEPVEVAGFPVPNRLVSLPMEGQDGQNGTPSALTFHKYERLAKGGYGVIWLEATSISEAGKSNDLQLEITEENLAEFTELNTRMKKAGLESAFGKEPMTVLQLNHSGRYSNHNKKQTATIMEHKKPLDEKRKIPADHPLVTDEYLDSLPEQYVQKARLAKKAGFDAVDLKACHGYLTSEALASFDRDGRYGGSFENRTKLLLNIIKAVKEDPECEGLILASRLNLTDALSDPKSWGMSEADAEQIDLTEPFELIRQMKEAGISLIAMTMGNPYFKPNINKPSDLKKDEDLESPLVSCTRLIQEIAKAQAAFPDLAIVNVGYSWFRGFAPNLAEHDLRAGKMTLAGFGRAAISYGDMPNDLKNFGVADRRKACTTCNKCSELKANFLSSGCVVREPEIYLPFYRELQAMQKGVKV